jgi:hypothetical protein
VTPDGSEGSEGEGAGRARMVLQAIVSSRPPASTRRCCARNVGEMTSPMLDTNRLRKNCFRCSSCARQCSCWSVALSMTPATNAPSSVDRPCAGARPRHTAPGAPRAAAAPRRPRRVRQRVAGVRWARGPGAPDPSTQPATHCLLGHRAVLAGWSSADRHTLPRAPPVLDPRGQEARPASRQQRHLQPLVGCSHADRPCCQSASSALSGPGPAMQERRAARRAQALVWKSARGARGGRAM